MTHEFVRLTQHEIIKILYKDNVSFDDRMNIVHELCREHIDGPSPKILIDARRSQLNMTKAQQEIWGQFVASREELANARVAVIYRADHHINNTAREKASALGHQIESFNSEVDAIDWLTSK